MRHEIWNALISPSGQNRGLAPTPWACPNAIGKRDCCLCIGSICPCPPICPLAIYTWATGLLRLHDGSRSRLVDEQGWDIGGAALMGPVKVGQ
jgi:hypothetical protein